MVLSYASQASTIANITCVGAIKRVSLPLLKLQITITNCKWLMARAYTPHPLPIAYSCSGSTCVLTVPGYSLFLEPDATVTLAITCNGARESVTINVADVCKQYLERAKSSTLLATLPSLKPGTTTPSTPRYRSLTATPLPWEPKATPVPIHVHEGGSSGSPLSLALRIEPIDLAYMLLLAATLGLYFVAKRIQEGGG